MFAKIILCASNFQLTAGIWSWGRLKSFKVFQNDLQGHQDFDNFIQENLNSKIYLLADTVEEDYRLENFPHTSGKDRKELINRKLNQVYRNLDFRTAHYIGRENDKRKDDRFLFLSLNSTELLDGWLNIIEARQAPLAGVYLLSMTSQVFLKRMNIKASNVLLSERLTSGLRQTYFQDGNLRISRLAPVPSDMQKRKNYFYLIETEKTRLYLISQRFINKETQLGMVIPSLDLEDGQLISKSVEQEQGIECVTVDLNKFARKRGLSPVLLETNPELLHMHLLAGGHLSDNLAPPSLIRFHKINALKNAINITSLVILIMGLSLSAWYFNQIISQSSELDLVVSQRQNEEKKYQDVSKDFPDTPIESSDLKAAVELNEAIRGYRKTPENMMQIISNAINSIPEIQINRLRWMQTNEINIKDEDKTFISQKDTAPVKSYNFSTDSHTLYELAFVNGEIKNFNGDYRSALNTVNKFAEQLKSDPSVAIAEVVQAPVNVSSFSNLQGSTVDETTSQHYAALFKIKVVLKKAGDQ